MVCHHIPNNLKEMALSMSLQGLQDSEIQEYTGISVQSIKQLWRTHHKTGTVSCKPLIVGRQRILTAMEVKVCYNIPYLSHHLTLILQFLCNCVEHQPNVALSELKNELFQVFQIEVSVQTVAHSLQQEGYTMKTVHHLFFSPWLTLISSPLDYTACSGVKWARSCRL